MRLALVGATGLVGRKMLQVLEERKLIVEELLPVASEKSYGHTVEYNGRHWGVISVESALAARPDFALFSAGAAVSKELAPLFAEIGCTVIDNSSCWRMDPSVPLVVPEINASAIGNKKIIANPNCSTIQLVMVLAPLHQLYQCKRVVVSTYQAVSGTGKQAVEQMFAERTGMPVQQQAYPYPIDLNLIPQCDTFLDTGSTKEEMKLVHETVKILDDKSIQVSATAVRVPVENCHSESVNLEFENAFDLKDVVSVLRKTPGVVVIDNPEANRYPMPLLASEKDEVFVGRIRRDPTVANGLNLFIVADNLRKGAATNAVQILEYLLKHKS